MANIEHIGIVVADALEMAAWYKRVLGFDILTSSQGGGCAGAFISDTAKRVVLELIANPGISPLVGHIDNPVQLHIALASDDLAADIARLVAEGAVQVSEPSVTPDGDTLALLKDPWGHCLQLAKRAPGRELLPK
jgi:glyoxylase I family protein